MFNILVHPHLPSDSPLKKAANALDFLEPYARWLGARDKTLSRWFLAAGSLEEALQYEAFAKSQATQRDMQMMGMKMAAQMFAPKGGRK